MISENTIDIKKICLQFKGSWKYLSDDILMTVESPTTKQEFDLLFMELVKGQISIFAPLHPNQRWKTFGYRYFDPEDRDFFSYFFKQSYVGMDPVKVIENLNHVLNA